MKSTESPSSISEHDRELLERLYDVINGEERPVLLGREGAHLQFPEPIFHHLTKIVRSMLSGQSIMVMASNEELTTQAAANLLGVSRPHLVKLLEEGEIPFHLVGTHRRIYLHELRDYEKRRDIERRKTLDNLSEKIIEAGLYDSDYTGEG